MLRVVILAASAVALAGLSFVLFSGADSQIQPKALVVLQPTTPGTPQAGHSNLNGTSRAGQFMGGGAGLTSVNADLLDGHDSTAFLQSIPVPLALAGSSPTHIFRADNASTASGSAALMGISSAATGETFGVFGQTDSVSGRAIYGLATSVGTAYAGYFVNEGSNPAVYAQAKAAGLHARATTIIHQSFGVVGDCIGPIAGSAGVSGISYAQTAETYGVSGLSKSSSGIGVYGNADSLSGDTFGGLFEARSTSGIGVFAHASRSSGPTYAVYALTRSGTGVGVYGAVDNTTGTGVGVWGRGESPTGWGVYANGRLGASGGKSFRIDHPLDPENKWLLHYCSEGPEPLNVYSGSTTTDAQGFATIHLPDYFEEINRDPRVQLTVDDISDDFVMAKVVGGVNDGVCRIRTSKPRVKVYWEVKAVRHDRWMQKHGAPVEQEKVEQELGKYQHPELYGLPPEMGIARRDVRGK